ncbi:MAG: pin [Micrococcaceae bacterium]|jgi:hypothetical protein|nr:pin [Micrococcaceae bacterium]
MFHFCFFGMSSATLESMGHLLGYARVSTTDQDAALQVDALTAAGCYRVFVSRPHRWVPTATQSSTGHGREANV